MSCFVMVRRASDPVAAHPYPACGSSIAFRSTPFPPPRGTRRTLRMAAFAPPAPNAANIAYGGVDAAADLPGKRDPVSRVSRARPSARVSAGAVRAPDCAREPEDALRLCVESGSFRAGPARREAVRADATSVEPILA